MNRVQPVLLLAGLSLASSLQASPSFYPSGSNITFGHTSNTQIIHAYSNNPAMGASALKDGDGNFKWGIFSATAGGELGDVNNIEKVIDDLSQNFDTTTITGNTPAEVDASIQQVVDGFNTSLEELDKNGYFKVNTNLAVASPLVVAADWLGGALVFDMNFSVAFKGEVLHQNIYFTTADPANPNSNLDDIDYNMLNNTIAINNDSSVLGSAAAIGEFSLGYSRLFYNNGDKDLYGGLRLKALRVGLYREAIKLSDTNNDISNTITDFNADDVQSKMTADVGVLYTTKHYRLGATFKNLTSPSFDYNGLDLSTYNSNPNNTDKSVYNRLSQSQSFTMDRQLILEGALYTENRYWVINGSYDANAVSDPFGDEYKWMVVSAAYASDSFLIPGFRVGMRKNMAGSQLSYLTAGTTLFNILDLDAAYGLQSVEVDGSSYPRSVYVSAGVSVNF